MSNQFQSKLETGLSKVQGGLEQGRQKLQVVQEINRLKKEIQEASVKKSNVLLEVGQATYAKIRNGEIEDPALLTITGQLIALDQQIYQSTMKISQLNSRNQEGQGKVCTTCQTSNGVDAKFCGGCGGKIDAEVKVELSVDATCDKCEESIPASAHFCPCCGSKVANK